jgi:hypothetical protein
MPFTVLGVLVFEREFTADPFTSGSRGVFRSEVIAAGAIAVLVTFGLLARRSRRVAVAVLGCFFAFAAIDVEPRALRPIDRWSQRLVTLHEEVRSMGVASDIAYDRSNIDVFGLNGYQFYLHEHQFVLFDGTLEKPPADFVIAAKTWPKAEAWKARRVASEPMLNQALWRMPGRKSD